ncbi:hypothetical protein MR578_07505, partial [bacterium]|nr:hypothetical protein [bacterium]
KRAEIKRKEEKKHQHSSPHKRGLAPFPEMSAKAGIYRRHLPDLTSETFLEPLLVTKEVRPGPEAVRPAADAVRPRPEAIPPHTHHPKIFLIHPKIVLIYKKFAHCPGKTLVL